jgi:hypothetical protein
MRTFIVKFIPKDDSGNCIIHKIPIPDVGEKGFYRIVGSWNAFSTGKRKGATKEERRKRHDGVCWAPTGLYYTHDAHEEEWLEKVRRQLEWVDERTDLNDKQRAETKARVDETKFPTVEHASLYDFYDYIGFDRKARRYKACC